MSELIRDWVNAEPLLTVTDDECSRMMLRAVQTITAVYMIFEPTMGMMEEAVHNDINYYPAIMAVRVLIALATVMLDLVFEGLLFVFALCAFYTMVGLLKNPRILAKWMGTRSSVGANLSVMALGISTFLLAAYSSVYCVRTDTVIRVVAQVLIPSVCASILLIAFDHLH